ncbi:transposase domain-containing protein [Frigidibacter oleivorans]|uniref:transposase domain-containing protein n=1 Tax=Frigidibacter oleivorans TaxID=2487129 RepID=UPI000F8E5E3B|nr:transposase domain-containing protein [Frigidibacter oleivorans]
MTRIAPAQEWWTAAEIAAANLTDMPSSQQGVEALAKRLNWRGHLDLARRRTGRGGGWEYSWKLFPARAQQRLLAQVILASVEIPAVSKDRDAAWQWFDQLPESVKAKARSRLLTLQKVEALASAGHTKNLAVVTVARLEKIAARSIWNWFDLVEGVRLDDRLAYLAPRHRAVQRRPAKAAVDLAFMEFLKSDYLRPAGPSFSSCFRRAVRVAEEKGWSFADERTLRRRLDAEVSEATQVLARKGLDALKRLYPSQVRDKTALHAMEVVNADFHKFDVFVRWPGDFGQDERPYVGRPQMVAFQDIHSGRILAWRVDQTPNSTAVALAAGDMIETWGIPEHILLDNGREFAAKALTGGAPTRYRFKVRPSDVPGLFTTLGCKIHWATPYSGQSKPIERAFRDMCDSIAKDPRFDGAYTGNRPDAKPEDYGSRVIDLDAFLSVLAEGIEEHNTRQGRRSEVAYGRSFAEVFDESYATAPIRKATEAQRRLWLLGAEGLTANRRTGLVRFRKNEYWAPWMADIAGQQIIIRFDPADLWAGLHIYGADNSYLGEAPCRDKAGFMDMAEARSHSKARKTWLTAEKLALAAHRKLKASEIGAVLNSMPIVTGAAPPEAKVVRPVFRRAEPPAPPVAAPEIDAAHAAVVADLASRRAPERPEEAPRERFRRALELERALARGGSEATADQQRWLRAYQTTPEYRAEKMIWDDFGDAIFG